MNKPKISHLISTYTAPVAVILGGLVLLFSPDTATALISTVLGWSVLVIGILLGLAAFAGGRGLKEFLTAAVCVAAGLWLTRNPLSLAVAFGKLLGLGLLLGGISGWRRSVSSGGRSLSLAEGAMGVVLLLAPLAASRLVYTIVGVLLVIAGLVMLANRARNAGRLDKGRDDIIDAL